MPAKSFRIFLLGIFLLTLAGRSPIVSAQSPQPEFLMGSQLVIRVGSGYSTLHIPAPVQAGLRRSSISSNMMVDYVPNGVNGCVQFPDAARTAYQFAADIWASLLTVSVPLHIQACWKPLGANVLGSAGPTFLVRDSPNLPLANIYYPLGLANNFAEYDLSTANPEIDSSFNSQFGAWYFGTDGSPGMYKYDFVSVALHEIGHGLGFAGGIQPAGYTYLAIFDHFAKNKNGVSLTSLSSSDRAAVMTGDNINNPAYFGGAHAVAANGGWLVPLYSPNPWNPGSSYSHLGESFNSTTSALMTFSLPSQQAVHDPGPVTLGILADLGWSLAAPSAPSNLNAQAASDSQINLTWQDHSSDESGFEVERSPNGSSVWVKLATTAVNAIGYADIGLSQGTAYDYRVRAIKGSLASAYTLIASATTHTWPAAPSNLSAVALGLDKVRLKWTDNSANESGFRIERSANLGSTWTTLADIGANITTLTDSGLTKATQYTYRISSLIGDFQSSPDGPVTVTTWAVLYQLNIPTVMR